MTIIYEADNNLKEKLSSMFENLDDTAILSCLQGHMGKAWVDDLEKPTVAQIIVGDFVFYAGDPYAKGAKELLYNLPDNILAIVDTEDWKKRLEIVHKGSIEKIQRYRFNKNADDLDKSYLQSFLSTLPKGYELKDIDATLVKESSLHEISVDFTGQFANAEDYLARGIGFAIVYEEQVVCGASSYSVYDKGIEIEIGTHPDHRRKGLATIAASALILECFARGIYPSWDAANLESVHLAEKLGYILIEAYDTYYINLNKTHRGGNDGIEA